MYSSGKCAWKEPLCEPPLYWWQTRQLIIDDGDDDIDQVEDLVFHTTVFSKPLFISGLLQGEFLQMYILLFWNNFQKIPKKQTTTDYTHNTE